MVALVERQRGRADAAAGHGVVLEDQVLRSGDGAAAVDKPVAGDLPVADAQREAPAAAASRDVAVGDADELAFDIQGHGPAGYGDGGVPRRSRTGPARGASGPGE